MALLRTSGLSIPALARALGISDQTLRNWQRQARVAAGPGRAGELPSADREALRRRREVKVLLQERESLRQATACFAKETR